MKIQCTQCQGTCALLRHFDDRFPHERGQSAPVRRPAETIMVVPPAEPRELSASAPDGVRSFFTEAARCEAAGALRGAAVLYRAAVEEMLNDLMGVQGLREWEALVEPAGR